MIESKDNKIIKTIKSLYTKKGRDKENQFIIEGSKFIDNSYKYIDFFLISETFSQKNDIDSLTNFAKVHIAQDSLFKYISDTISPQGVLAVCNKINSDISKINLENAFILIGENIQDPGNLGTLIRTADSAGVDFVLLSKNSTDLYNPKVVRSTAGSIFNVPIIENCDLIDSINYLKENGVKIIAAHLKGEEYFYNIDFTKKIALLVGNEGNGLSDEITNYSDYLVKIPMLGKSESLNASVASGILLYEVVRQRNFNI